MVGSFSVVIADYNSPTPYYVKSLDLNYQRSIKIGGLLCLDSKNELWPKFVEDVAKWLLEGVLVCKEDVTGGLENALDAFVGVLRGKNIGKGIVKIADL